MPQVKWGKPNHFEGWYFKNVDNSQTNAVAIIPGVSFGKTSEESHSFIQVFDARHHESYYFNFPIDAFESDHHQFQVSLDGNEFRMDGISLNLSDGKNQITGSLTYGTSIPWPVRRFTPGAMGPFRFIPRMQTQHGILSFDHEIQGTVRINQREIDFSKGRGYIEKDWGKEFPCAWIWMQSNHFDEIGISFTASIANIPWMKRSFTGFLIGLLYDNTVHRFTTYTRAKLSTLEVSKDAVTFTVKDKRFLIEVNAKRSPGVMLRSPIEGLMTGRILESLDSAIHLKFWSLKKSGKKLIYEGTGRSAGLEVVGDLSEIGATEV
jgi:hypothetical protein